MECSTKKGRTDMSRQPLARHWQGTGACDPISDALPA